MTIDLQKFCARSDESREHLRQPWAHRGSRYACNGHILVRVASPADVDAASDNPLAQKVIALLAAAGKANYIPLPLFPAPKKCFQCNGKGQYPQLACDDCDGKGEFTHDHHTYECKECEGDGYLEAEGGGAELRDCPLCHGVGYERGSRALVGGSYFDTIYLRLLARLPGLRISVSGDNQGAHFVFDGGEGLLMPLRS